MNKILEEDFERINKDRAYPSLFEGKTVLITGSTGFIGSYFAKYLCYLKISGVGCEVFCAIRDADKVKKQFTQVECELITFIKYDFNSDTEFGIEGVGRVDFIFHLASIATPKYFESDPVGVMLPNSLGLFKIFQMARKHETQKIIYFSTTGVNGFVDNALRPITENIYGALDCADLTNCYLEAKRFGEMFSLAMAKQYQLSLFIVRPAITYGPGIDFDDGRSYADFIRNIVQNRDIVLHSTGEAIRNFCYVSDFINGLLLVTFYGKSGEPYNVASDTEISIKNLAELLVNEIFPEKKLKVIHRKPNVKFKRINFERTTVSIKKTEQLGWKLAVDLREGFRRTVEYYNQRSQE